MEKMKRSFALINLFWGYLRRQVALPPREHASHALEAMIFPGTNSIQRLLVEIEQMFS